MPGPAPMPNALRSILNNPGKRAIKEEPARLKLDKLPDAPNFLSEHGKLGWYTLGRILQDMSLLDQSNTVALAVMCEMMATWQRLQKDVQQNGRYQTVRTAQGDLVEKRRPQAEDLADVERRLLTYLKEFGLTPSALTKVGRGGKPETEANPEDAYFED